MVRRVLTFATISLGMVLLGYGLFAMAMTLGASVSDLPGSPAATLRDQAVVTMMGGGLLLLGALRLATKRPGDE